MIKYIVGLIILLPILSCCNRAIEYDRELDRVKQLLIVSPDSAWTVLKKIDYNEPRHVERKAKYALLYTQVQDRRGVVCDKDSFISIAVKYYEKNGTIDEKFQSFYFYGKSLVEQGDYVRALSYFSKAENLKEQIEETSYKELLSEQIENLCNRDPNLSSILHSQHKYLGEQIAEDVNGEKYNRNSIAIWVLGVVILIGLRFVYFYEQLWRKNKDLHSYAEVICELKNSINNKEAKMGELARIIYKEQNKHLNLISASFYDKEDNPQGQRMLYREVKSIIEKFRHKKTQQEIEISVNKNCNNVMKKLRMEIINMEEDEYIQVCFHIVGFSSKLISLILGVSDINVNTRKFRIRKRIELSNTVSAEEFLQYLK